MQQKLLIFFLILLPTLAFGQKKYKHHYRAYLKAQESTYTSNTSDTTLEANNAILSFQILDNKGAAVPLVYITIKDSLIEKTIRSDFDGLASLILSTGTYSITTFDYQFTSIKLANFILKENTKTIITTSLGPSNAFRIALIYSLRKLTETEIKKIVDDLSTGKENELIKNKTCYISWEI